MASTAQSVTLRRGVYTCASCCKAVRPLPGLHRRASARSLHTASWTWSSRDITTRSLPHAARSSGTRTKARFYTSTSPAQQPTGSGIARLPHRRLVSLSGPDASKFLQGLVTNNVDASRQTPFYAAFLDARGRVLWDVFVWTWPKLIADKGHWACYIEIDQSEADALKKHLKRHKLRSKVVIEDVGEQTGVWAAWGSATEEVNDAHIIARLSDPRAPELHRYLAKADHESLIQGVEPVDTIQYHLQRYEYGVAEGPIEIPRESALPMEYNIDLSSGIDFKKGCYVGQELTIRTKHTGVVRKRMLPVQLEHPDETGVLPEPGSVIKQLDGRGALKPGRAAGKYVAGIGTVGLALCRLEMMTSMKISAEGGTWKPGMRFGIDTPHGVFKVRPVLHDWFVVRERDLWDKNRTRI